MTMEITLWGVRGSMASPALNTTFYGGNTACIELCSNAGTLVFFDAGTGLREAGASLPDSGECHLFITHAHADHIVALWFFRPLHLPDWTVHLHLPNWLGYLPDYFFAGGVFPVPFNSLKGHVIHHSIRAHEEVCIGTDKMRVTALPTCHPDDCLAYRVDVDAARFFYSGDHEIKADDAASLAATREMLKGADIAVVDATYERGDYKRGWGHSTWEDWVDAAQGAGVRNLVLTHHEVGKSDQELDRVAQKVRAYENPDGVEVFLARENLHVLPDGPIPSIRLESDWMLRFLDELSRYKDENVSMDRILAMARTVTNADAGTIFLVDGDELAFAYTHNDSLFPVSEAYKYAYATSRLPISKDSIAGYVACTGEALNLEDVRQLPPDVPYRFNDRFDWSTGYRTCSMLTVPFLDFEGRVCGVLQLINRLVRKTRQPAPFTLDMAYTARLMAREAGSIIAHNALYRRNVYNILKMARVHDPSETGPHAERVGAVASELYQRWAEKNKRPPEEIRYEKSRIRLAAMLHDIGKVGISDLILRKQGNLNEEEYRIMRSHTELGASILAEETDSISILAHDIALHHHQKWNGKGYAGSGNEGRLAGKEIPLAARITSIADVFDALISPRCYKEAWTFEDALALLHKEAGQHFDPELVACMEEIRDMLPMIYQRFPDAAEPPPQ
ncbi:MAG: HD domain-containing protein [Zoogloeaceae bacterium]|jgi:HD-GYP domain-containing protein (c-di-GMP phosphodiesterase class II)/phosphoribosyl 1,2-cyclic phosphodiesterase|nr:HD domain-containing protein [Zoogloeaceae bacterium]